MMDQDIDLEWDEEALDDRDGGTELLGALVINWRTADTHQTAEAMRELTDWVAWLVPRYNITTQHIPDCWAQHSDLIEELSALHTAWLVSFDETDGGYGPIGWHERFTAALTRKTFRDRCPTQHRPDTKRTLPTIGKFERET